MVTLLALLSGQCVLLQGRTFSGSPSLVTSPPKSAPMPHSPCCCCPRTPFPSQLCSPQTRDRALPWGPPCPTDNGASIGQSPKCSSLPGLMLRLNFKEHLIGNHSVLSIYAPGTSLGRCFSTGRGGRRGFAQRVDGSPPEAKPLLEGRLEKFCVDL